MPKEKLLKNLENDTGETPEQTETSRQLKEMAVYAENQQSETLANKEPSFGDLVESMGRSDKPAFDEKRVLNFCTKENFLGRGKNANVYEIPGMEKYVLKVEHGVEQKKEVDGKIEEVKDVFPEFNFGQAVARISNEGIYLLKKQNGVPAGVPNGDARKKSEIGDTVYEDHLQRTSEIPQSAYDEFAESLIVINHRDHQFDPKFGNVLVDPEKGKFNLVDITKRNEGSNYKNGIVDMMVSLMDNSYAGRYKGVAPVEGYRKEILQKCIEAGKKVGWEIPEPGEKPSIDYSFKLAGIERPDKK